jgi:hypothetical protein
MHAMRMTQIIQKHSEDTAREGVSMFNTTMLAASDKKMLSCTFKNQSREELSSKYKALFRECQERIFQGYLYQEESLYYQSQEGDHHSGGTARPQGLWKYTLKHQGN